MASGEAGLIAWCNQIRFTMARDPGRKDLENQVQSGFDFIDNYLETVFSRSQYESVGELLKTPGRKKDAPVRTRAATAAAAKVRSVVAMSLEDTDTEHENQNQAPVNSFHKALLKAKEQGATTKGTSHTSSNDTSLRSHKAVTIVSSPVRDMVEEPVAPASPHPSPPPSATESSPEPQILHPSSSDAVQHMLGAESEHETLSAGRSGSVKELSMIAEDDEFIERSRISGQLPASNGSNPATEVDVARVALPRVEVAAPTNMDVDEPPQEDMTTHTFDSIPLDSPPRARPLSNAPSEYFTAPLPQARDDTRTADIPIMTEAEIFQIAYAELPPIRDYSPAGTTFVRTQFAGLPAPSPLHKSTRGAPEPAAGPGTAAGGGAKRSSWLVKAREAKAMEFTGKRTSALTPTLGVPGASNGTKRKSGEMLGAPPVPPHTADDGERLPKVPKLAEATGEPDAKGKGKEKEVEPEVDAPSARVSHSPSRDLAVPMHVGDDEGVLDRFKRTVSGLGARVGKSSGKSLGGRLRLPWRRQERCPGKGCGEHMVDGSPAHAPTQILPQRRRTRSDA
ncbi:hypothetical protein B0H21DRAFT_37969 [Amylocystis lapponica]|nr:hypothetical protein B0H21DRAFT_37969 [Amylocystis lapponica]